MRLSGCLHVLLASAVEAGWMCTVHGQSRTTNSGELCEEVLVEVTDAEHQTHAGVFSSTGATVGNGYPTYITKGGYILMFIEDGSLEEESYSTFIEPEYVIGDDEPGDDVLSLDDFVSGDDTSISRRLITCGHWVIGKKNNYDIATYPMLKVEECANDPADIDPDSEWFRKSCHNDVECQIIYIGKVTISSATYECGTTPSPVPLVKDVGTASPGMTEAVASPAPAFDAAAPPASEPPKAPSAAPGRSATRAPVGSPETLPPVALVSIDGEAAERDGGGGVSSGTKALAVGLGVGGAVLLVAGAGAVWTKRAYRK